MKVVKCLEHIPKEIRGRVVKDDIHIICANTMYQLKPSDTFPLPQQGDEVEVSENGLFTDFEERKASFMVYYKGVFVTDEGGFYDNWEYIRPIEVKEERSEFRELAERLDRVYKIVYKYVNGINPPKTDKS